MFKYFTRLACLSSIIILLNSCESDNRYVNRLNDASLFNDTMQVLTDVIGW